MRVHCFLLLVIIVLTACCDHLADSIEILGSEAKPQVARIHKTHHSQERDQDTKEAEDEERGMPGLSKIKCYFQKFPVLNKIKSQVGKTSDLNQLKAVAQNDPEIKKLKSVVGEKSIRLTSRDVKAVEALKAKDPAKGVDILQILVALWCAGMLVLGGAFFIWMLTSKLS